jgi:transposase
MVPRSARTCPERSRRINVPAGDFTGLQQAITHANTKLGLPTDAPVRACYEAGRDGFWIHRRLRERGLENVVVDAASIEVDRRQRRANSPRSRLSCSGKPTGWTPRSWCGC